MTKTNAEAVETVQEFNHRMALTHSGDITTDDLVRYLNGNSTMLSNVKGALIAAFSPTAKTEPSAAGLGLDFAACLLDYDDVKNETAEARLAAFAYDNRQSILAALSAPTREREMLDLLAICREWLEPDAAYTMATRTEVFARIDNLLNEGSGQ